MRAHSGGGRPPFHRVDKGTSLRKGHVSQNQRIWRSQLQEKGREKPSSQTWDQCRGFCGVQVCQDLGQDECGGGGGGRQAGSSQQIEPSWIATAITILKAYYVQGTLRILTYFILRTALSDRYYSPPHFTDKETEAREGFKCRQSGSRACAMMQVHFIRPPPLHRW